MESERRSQQTVPANGDEGVSQPSHHDSRSTSRSAETGVDSHDSLQRGNSWSRSRYRSRSRSETSGKEPHLKADPGSGPEIVVSINLEVHHTRAADPGTFSPFPKPT
ncbi:hypothetical protein MRX96_031726 [Rhipicephalus microplus]